MPLISDKSQKTKLKNFNINIKTKYIVDNNILERNTDNSYNDDIKNGIRCKKEYYLNGQLLKEENQFDSRIEYTYISKEQDNTEYTCPNCGFHSKLKDFVDGCKYCGTYYNMDYTEKDLGGKYHYDRVLRSAKYRIITAFIDIIFSLICSYFFIKLTSRTFNEYDISKIYIYGGILSLILYYFFYIIDAYIILSPIKAYKDAQNQKQIDFWDKTKIDKKQFYNNLNYEIRNKYFSSDDIIDYDVIDYDEFTDSIEDKVLCVKVKAYVRIVKYINGKIVSKYVVDTYKMKQSNTETFDLKDGVNIISCHNCGASIDATKEKCVYCNTKIDPLYEWVMIDK